MATVLKFRFLSLTFASMIAGTLFSAEDCQLYGRSFNHLPNVRFSNIGFDRNGNVVSGYFDIFYFNSEAPLDAKVSVRTGLELGLYDSVSKNYLPYNQWFNEQIREMAQWEEFGWYVRIPVTMFYNRGWYKALAIDMIFTVNGVEEGDSKTLLKDSPHKKYIRGQIPDFKTCFKEQGSSPTGSCKVDVEQVSKI